MEELCEVTRITDHVVGYPKTIRRLIATNLEMVGVAELEDPNAQIYTGLGKRALQRLGSDLPSGSVVINRLDRS